MKELGKARRGAGSLTGGLVGSSGKPGEGQL
jgi:hypothetical protein